MPDIWSIGPTAAAHGLRAHGFSFEEANRLVDVLQRDARGAFPDLEGVDRKRLLFACWLVDRRKLGNGQRRGWLAPEPELTEKPAAPTAPADTSRAYERSAA